MQSELPGEPNGWLSVPRSAQCEKNDRQTEPRSGLKDSPSEPVVARVVRKTLDKSIEDLVDEVTQKAERWIDEQTSRMFDSTEDEREVKRAETQAEKAKKEARKARQSADQAGRAAEDLSGYEESVSGDSDFEDFFEEVEQPSKRARGRSRRAREKARSSGEKHGFAWAYYEWPQQSRFQGTKAKKCAPLS